ncbi:MAG: shikimate dehydrogenase family protein [Bdellovibrionia bacterium]
MEPLSAGLIGHPVSHSLSPEIFRWLSVQLHRPLHYQKLDVPPEKLRSFFALQKQFQMWVGWSVTIPHKEKVMNWVEELSPEAQAIGAVNCVSWKKGRLIGFNTDALGVKKSLQEAGFRFSGARAVIYGAGGAALAVGAVLGKYGAREVAFINRSITRAKRAAHQLSSSFPKTRFWAGSELKAIAWSPSLSKGAGVPRVSLFVNATPVGMQGFSDQTFEQPLFSGKSPGALALDLIYRPEKTPFLTLAAQEGLKTLGGLDMLLWQAMAAWEIWMGQRIAQPKKIKASLKLHLQKLMASSKKPNSSRFRG